MFSLSLKSVLLASLALLLTLPTRAADFPTVNNTGEPLQGESTLDLEEVWRLGGDSESDEEFFGVVGAMTEDSAGNIYLLDNQLTEIRVFAADGEYLRTIGRNGEGPGEFRRPMDVFTLPDGNIGVVEARPAKVVVLSPDGEPLDDLTFQSVDPNAMVMVRRGQGSGTSIVVELNQMQRGEGTMSRTARLVAFDLSGSETGVFAEKQSTIDFANPIFREDDGPSGSWGVSPDGHVFLADNDGSYRLWVHAPDGTVVRCITRDQAPVPRTDEEKAAAKRGIRIRGPIDPTVIVRESEPLISGVFPRADGSVWVQGYLDNRNTPDGTLAVFDVFDAEGRYQQRITLLGEANIETDRILVRENQVVVIRHFTEAMDSMFAGRGGGGEQPEETDDADDAEPIEIIGYALGTRGAISD